MAIFKILLCAGWLISLHALSATEMEKKETIDGVTVQTGKKDSTRVYQGNLNRSFPFALELVKKGVVNFNEKCNNSFKDRRKFTDKNIDCKYHNDNLVETIVLKDLKQGWTKEANEVERFVLGRQIYNRGSFGYYELVQIFEEKNEQGQRVVRVVQTMLDDDDAKKYISPKFEQDSAFNKSTSQFTLTEVGTKETNMEYQYRAKTDHFILNKEISVPQVFTSISKSINDLMKTVEAESSLQFRDVASN